MPTIYHAVIIGCLTASLHCTSHADTLTSKWMQTPEGTAWAAQVLSAQKQWDYSRAETRQAGTLSIGASPQKELRRDASSSSLSIVPQATYDLDIEASRPIQTSKARVAFDLKMAQLALSQGDSLLSWQMASRNIELQSDIYRHRQTLTRLAQANFDAVHAAVNAAALAAASLGTSQNTLTEAQLAQRSALESAVALENTFVSKWGPHRDPVLWSTKKLCNQLLSSSFEELTTAPPALTSDVLASAAAQATGLLALEEAQAKGGVSASLGSSLSLSQLSGGNPLSWLLSFALQLNWNIAEWLLKDKLVAYRQSDALALEHATSTTENAARSAWAASVALTRASCAQYAYKYKDTARLQAELVLVQQAYDAHGVSRTALRSKEIAAEQAALAELLQEQAVLEQLPALKSWTLRQLQQSDSEQLSTKKP